MLRSMLLSSVRPFFAPDDDKRAAAQAERDKIKVESSKKVETKEPEKVKEADDDKGDDKKGDDDKSEDGEDDDKEGNEEGEKEEGDDGEKKEKEEPKELTAAEYKKELEAAQKKVSRLERRTGKTAGERDTLKRELAEARAALNAKAAEGEGLTEEEVTRRAKELAAQMNVDSDFTKAVQKLNKDALKIDLEFKNKITELTADISPVPGSMIAILEDLDNENGGAVLAHLADNPDEYEELYELPMAKMSNRLNRISDKLKEAAKKPEKKISKIPPPIDTIKGSEKSPTQLPANPTKNMPEFIAMRNKQVEARRKARLG